MAQESEARFYLYAVTLPGTEGGVVDLEQMQQTERALPARIAQLYEGHAVFCRRAVELLRAAALIDARREPGLLLPEDREKARRRAAGVARRELGPVPKQAEPGRRELGFLRSMTGDGLTGLPETVPALADRVWLLDDGCGLAPDYLRVIAEEAQKRALHHIVCPNPLHPEEPEAVFLPERRLAFLTAAATGGVAGETVRHVRLDSIPDIERRRALRSAMRADAKLQQALLSMAEKHLQSAAILYEEIRVWETER